MEDNQYLLRPATCEDIPALVVHRRRMFEDIGQAKGEWTDPAKLDALAPAAEDYIKQRLQDGLLHIWVIQYGDEIVASGAVTILTEFPPHYHSSKVGRPYMHSVYTAPEHRRKGLARRIIQQAIDFCRERGFSQLRLHASPDGLSLYEAMGFEKTREMRLKL